MFELPVSVRRASVGVAGGALRRAGEMASDVGGGTRSPTGTGGEPRAGGSGAHVVAGDELVAGVFAVCSAYTTVGQLHNTQGPNYGLVAAVR